MRHAILRGFLFLLLIVLASLGVGCEAPVEEQAAEELPPEPEGPPKPKPGDYLPVEAGEFTMGSDTRPRGFENQPQLHEPEHKAETGAYEIGAYETTNAEFARFQIESDYVAEGDWRSYYSIERIEHPVANVTWDDAKAYCEWAGGRLPTEAEWEKAARGPEGFAYPWGNEWANTKSNCNEMGFRNTVEIGDIETDVSPYGAYDMMGNVQEWTAEKVAPYPNSPARRDQNFRRGFITARGGSYAIKGGSIGLWTRSIYLPKSQTGIGFRCVKDVEGAAGEAEGN